MQVAIQVMLSSNLFAPASEVKPPAQSPCHLEEQIAFRSPPENKRDRWLGGVGSSAMCLKAHLLHTTFTARMSSAWQKPDLPLEGDVCLETNEDMAVANLL